MFYSLVRTPNDRTLAMLRIVLGIVFFAHGAQKMLGWFGGPGFSTTMQLFGEMGVPSLLAFLAIAAEFFGGLALVFGLFRPRCCAWNRRQYARRDSDRTFTTWLLHELGRKPAGRRF